MMLTIIAGDHQRLSNKKDAMTRLQTYISHVKIYQYVISDQQRLHPVNNTDSRYICTQTPEQCVEWMFKCLS